MTDEGDVTSADQDAWLDIIRAMRAQLAKRVADIGGMNATDVKAFVEAVTETRWLNERTLYMDESIAHEKNKLPYDRD